MQFANSNPDSSADDPTLGGRDHVGQEVDLLEKFVRQLTDLTKYSTIQTVSEKNELLQTVSEVQTTADQILRHFVQLKSEMSHEVDARLQGAIAETIDSAIADTLEMKQALDVNTEDSDQALLEGTWPEQIARWVRLYAEWKDKKNVARQVMKNLASKVDQLIEKDIQFIEQYEKQSLSLLENDPETVQEVRERIHDQVAGSLQKLRALKKNLANIPLTEAGKWNEKIQQKRSTYLDSVLHKIESIIADEAPFRYEPTNITLANELEHECQFLENEVDHLLSLIPKIKEEIPHEITFIENRIHELRGYAEELLETAKPSSQITKRLRAILARLPKK